MTKQRKQELFIFLLLLGVTFLLWLPTLSFGFFSDDYHFLYITSQQTSVWKYFLTNNVGELSGGSYGPVLNVIFTLQYMLFEAEAFWYHVVSLLAYTGIAYTLYTLVKKITRKNTLGFVSGFLFLLLQNHVEAISWVAVQPHVFASLFFVLGLYLYYQFTSTKNVWRYIVSLLFFSLSIFTKETAIMFPCVLILVELFFGDRGRFAPTVWRIVKRMIPVSLVFGLFLSLRYSIVGYVAGYYAQESLGFSLIPKIKMFVELTVSMFVSSPYRQIVSGWFFEHKTLLVLVIVGVFILTHYAHKNYRKVLWFLLSSYVVISIPFLSLVFNPSHDGGERYAFLLSFFGISYVATLIYALTKDRKAGNIIFLFCITIFAFSSLSMLNPKLNYWRVSAQTQNNIFEDIRAYDYENTEFADYILFVGLPDNISGAELMRNAVKEAIYFETDFGFISGERIPVYTEFDTVELGQKSIDIEKSDDQYTYHITPLKAGERAFTGFKEYSFNLGVVTLDNFIYEGHSGDRITIVFEGDKLEEFQGMGYVPVIAYFDGKNMQFVPVNE
ncbi:hypothetical protein C0581_04270 [Candidatus Parcubacteria bacterium]|nr:MAG: hypothetical protein C0581_04270 [Candidatus Parcubacteria bacterium]